MSSTSEHLPKPEKSDEHQHVWRVCGERPVVVNGIKIGVYWCKCGTFLRRDQKCPT